MSRFYQPGNFPRMTHCPFPGSPAPRSPPEAEGTAGGQHGELWEHSGTSAHIVLRGILHQDHQD